VQRGDLQLYRAIDLRVGLPVYLHAALRVGVERLLTLAPVDRHPSAPRDEPDDCVTRQRIATSRVTHQHVVDTVDGNATVIAAPDLADYPLDRARAELGPGLLALVASPGRSANDLNHIFSLHLAVADREEKLFERPHTMRFEHPLQLVAIFRQLGKA